MFKSLPLVMIYFLIPFVSPIWAQEADLIAYWKFDEGTGKVVRDSIGGHDGTFVGEPRWVNGKFGKALEFDGKASYVVVPDAPDLAIEADITFAVWFRPSVTINSANNNWRMISKNNDYFLLFNYEKLGHLGWLVKDPTGTNHVVHSVTNEWKEGTWYHVAGTFDGNELKIYINGVEENSLKWSGKAGTSKLDLWIGADDLPAYYAGAIDDFRIYRRALRAEEIGQVIKGPLMTVQRLNNPSATTWGMIKTHYVTN